MQPTPLSTLSTGRDNNFNLIRFLAASLVIFTHAFGLMGETTEPLQHVVGLSFGSLAVDVFFVTSGFLIAKSWLNRGDPTAFFFARFMRIYPALWVSVAICGLVLGPAFTNLPLADYLRHKDTLKFLFENSTLLVSGTFKTLPGVFANQPSSDINAPLWTLPYELKMYIGLGVAGGLGLLARRGWVLGLVVGSFLAFAMAWIKVFDASERLVDTLRFIYLFSSGTAFYLYRDRVSISWGRCLGLIVGLFVALILTTQPHERRLLLALICPPLVVSLAFLPSGLLKTFNRVGDYSYGLYIFGMPVQQTIIAIYGKSSIATHFWFAYGAALLLAIISWHLVEQRMLALPLPSWLIHLGSRRENRHQPTDPIRGNRDRTAMAKDEPTV